MAVSPYTLKTFTGVPPAGATEPDDLAVSSDGKSLWIGYGNNAATDGSSGSSNVVEYDIASGTVLNNVVIKGHTDGLKIDPQTGEVWAIQNEDANPNLAIIDPKTGKFKLFNFATPPHGGGYDDLVFTGKNFKDVFIAASNPSKNPNTNPAIVEISGKPKKTTSVTPTLLGNASALNVVTNETETLNLQDPDSMTLDPAGELVLDSQADDELIIVRSSTATNPVLKIPLTMESAALEVNDTLFVTSTSGTILITDRDGEAIYTLTKPYFPPNEVYVAADAVGDVGLLDMNTGNVTPVVTGMVHPLGLAFSPISVAVAGSSK